VLAKTGRGLVLMLALLLSAAWVCPVGATEQDGRLLPRNSFGCVNCHAAADASFDSAGKAPSELNDFGRDFRDGDGRASTRRTWSSWLAKVDSDGDGCLNGFELGDPQGTWDPVRDVPSDQPQEYNPGDPDCSAASLTEKSWGILKAVFGDANQFKIR
jgi:hypothetical protein